MVLSYRPLVPHPSFVSSALTAQMLPSHQAATSADTFACTLGSGLSSVLIVLMLLLARNTWPPTFYVDTHSICIHSCHLLQITELDSFTAIDLYFELSPVFIDKILLMSMFMFVCIYKYHILYIWYKCIK